MDEQPDQQQPAVVTESQPPPLPPEKKANPLKVIAIVIGCVIGIISIGIVLLIFYVWFQFNSVSTSCDTQRTKIFNAARQGIGDFNAVVIIPGAHSTSAQEVTQDGDCFDSLPAAWLTRNVDVDGTAGDIINEVTASLQQQGYSGPTDIYGSTAGIMYCQDNSPVMYSKQGKPDITIQMNCAFDPKIEQPQDWRTLKVSQITAKASFEAK